HTSAAALRTTYWVPQIGSKFARLAWGTKRKVRAAAPWQRAGIERPPVAARLPTPANPFNTVLRSIVLSQSGVAILVPPVSLAEGSAPSDVKSEVKRAVKPIVISPLFLASDMPVRPARSTAEVSLSMKQNAFSSDHIFERLHPFMARPGLR